MWMGASATGSPPSPSHRLAPPHCTNTDDEPGGRGERWPLSLARLEEAAVDHHHLHVWGGDPHARQRHPAPAVHIPCTLVIFIAGRQRDVGGVDAGATLDPVNDQWAGLIDPREAHVIEAEAVVILVAAREAHRAARPYPPRRRDLAPTHAAAARGPRHRPPWPGQPSPFPVPHPRAPPWVMPPPPVAHV